jgi:hypothetical protein
VWLLGAVAAAAVAAALATLVGWNSGSALQRGVVQSSPSGVVKGTSSEVGQGASSEVGQGFSPASLTVGSLTSLALSDPKALDAALNRMSQSLLPDVEQPNHALSALGRNSQ